MSDCLKNVNEAEEIFDEIELKNFIHFDPCEICKSVTSDNINLSACSRLLEVNVVLKNVCKNKEITVGCIVMDKNDSILAFKSDTFVPSTKCNCSNSSGTCITANKKFKFILPGNNACSSLDLKLKVIANYTHPCNK